MSRPKLIRVEDGVVANQKSELDGLTFGSLKVIRRASIKDKKNSWWVCQCLLCGSIKNYRKVELYPERISCGCIGVLSKNNSHDFKGFGEISRAHFSKIKDTATRKKIEFNITIEDIWNLYVKQNRICALSGLKIDFGKSYRSRTKTASLDRIDSLRGYVNGNIQWVHKDVNYIKYTHSEQKLYNLCYKIFLHQNKKIFSRKRKNIVHLPVGVFLRYKNLAEKRQISWDLTHEQLREVYFKQNYKCPLSGEFLYFTDKYIEKRNCSLDRIDSSKGYTEENVQWILKELNIMKNKYSNEHFIDSCIKIYLHLKDKYDTNKKG